MSDSVTTGPAFTFENEPQQYYDVQGRRIMVCPKCNKAWKMLCPRYTGERKNDPGTPKSFTFEVDGEQATRCHECLSAHGNVEVKVAGESDIVSGAPEEWREKCKKLEEELANTKRKYRAALEAHWTAVEEIDLLKTASNGRLTDWRIQEPDRAAAVKKLSELAMLLGGTA